MKNTAIICYKSSFPLFYEILFCLGKLKNDKIEEKIFIENKEVKVINFPAFKKHLSDIKKLNVIINKFIIYLKKNGINKVFLSDEIEKISIIKEALRENFYIFEGKSIINFKFPYIIKKSIKSDEFNYSEIVIFSNDFETFYNYFNLIFKNYKINTLVTNYKNLFLSFSDYIFTEYGFLMNIYNTEEFISDKDKFLINIDTDLAYNYDIDIRNLSLILKKNDEFKNFYDFYNTLNEKAIEFLIYVLSNGIDKSKITEFFDKYNIRVVKINKK